MHKAGTSMSGDAGGKGKGNSYIGMCHGIGYGFLGAESLVGCQ